MLVLCGKKINQQISKKDHTTSFLYPQKSNIVETTLVAYTPLH